MYINEGSAIFSALAANSSLISELGGTALYERRVPTGTAYPYVVFMGAGRDTNESPRDVRYLDVTVKGISTSYAQAKRLAAHIRTALHGADDTLNMGTVWQVYRSQHTTDIDYTETVETKQIYHVGGVYRIRINEA